jgi:hypothetical protein
MPAFVARLCGAGIIESELLYIHLRKRECLHFSRRTHHDFPA